MQYSEAQIQDLLHLRQLFVHRVGQLARERKTLLENMAHCKMAFNHVCDKVSEMTKWSELLRENGAEEHRSYMQILTASGRGVSLLLHSLLYSNLQISAACKRPPTSLVDAVLGHALRKLQPKLTCFSNFWPLPLTPQCCNIGHMLEVHALNVWSM